MKENSEPIQKKTDRESVLAAAHSRRQDNFSFSLTDNRPKTVVQKKDNNTGLPDQLKSGIENLSGFALDDVNVHYNSSKPAQLNAHAFAQGTNIHISPGQQKYLAHEAWHVVQQKQGRVKPTVQLKNKININDDKGLEKEADQVSDKLYQNNKIENAQLSSGQTRKNIQLAEKKTGNNIFQLGRTGKNPYGRDVNTFSWTNLLTYIYDILDFLSIGMFDDIARLINLHNAHDAMQAVRPYAHRRIENIIRFVMHVGLRLLTAYMGYRHFLEPRFSIVLGTYFTMLIVNVLNWLHERMINQLGEYAVHGGGHAVPGRGSRLALAYLRVAEGVAPETTQDRALRKSPRGSRDTGAAMGRAEGLGERLSANTASGSSLHHLSRHLGYEWGHRTADSHGGATTADNLGSESMGANSQEMAGERRALELNRLNPGRVIRRNFALRFIGTLLDRSRYITISVDRVPLLREFVRSNRGPMTIHERTAHESDHANDRSLVIGFNLRNTLFVPLLILIFSLIVRYLF